jgi:hypothetical protein
MKTEIFETFWKFWNIEKKIKFWTLIFFFNGFRILKFHEIT